ncbi:MULTISPECIES: hypothetical protein [Rhodococcus]|nr:hypothetical protein [Rhodococcus sp. APC 3903]MDN3460131.1 hypothetical protein [Rhodococcus sp. APC 3903]
MQRHSGEGMLYRRNGSRGDLPIALDVTLYQDHILIERGIN